MDYVNFPELNIPEKIDENPETAAIQLREYWNLGLGPIENIVSKCEQNGLLVLPFISPSDCIDAFSQMVEILDESIYIIGYSDNKTSAARLHFDIAHELGHICLHDWSEDTELIPKETFKKLEIEANNFAAEFLLPKETFYKDVEKNPRSIPYYCELKKKWKVSIAAMVRRAYKFDLLSSDEYQMIMRTLQRRGMRKIEPLDNELLTASPMLIRTAIQILFNQGVFTPTSFVEVLSNEYHLSLQPREIEKLLALPDGMLTPSKIVQFPKLEIRNDK